MSSQNIYQNLTTIPDLYNEAIRFLKNLTKNKSKLKKNVEQLEYQFNYIINNKFNKDISEINESEILEDIIKDKEIKAKTNIKNSKNKFNFKRKDVFLTYSQADNEPDINTIYKELLNLDKDSNRASKICYNIELMFLVKELHKDGTPHFHVYIKFFEALDRSDHTLFNVPSLKSPKIVYVFNNRKVIRYMAKHLKSEKDWKENSIQHNMDAKFYIETDAYMLNELAYKMIKKEITPTEAIKRTPGLLYKAHTLYGNYNTYHTESELLKNPGKDLLDINIANLKFKFNPNKKKNENPQFWICGNTNSGKTYITDMLEKNGYNGYMPSIEEENWEDYSNKYTNFIHFEEYKGEKTVRFLNKLLEGTKMPLKIKGKSRTIKDKNIPIFIKSNYLPHEAYNNIDDNTLNLLLQRIYVIYLDENRQGHVIWNPKTDNFIKDYNKTLECMDNSQMLNYLKDKKGNLNNFFTNNYNDNFINRFIEKSKEKSIEKIKETKKIFSNKINPISITKKLCEIHNINLENDLCLACFAENEEPIKVTRKEEKKPLNNSINEIENIKCIKHNIEIVDDICFACYTEDLGVIEISEN